MKNAGKTERRTVCRLLSLDEMFAHRLNCQSKAVCGPLHALSCTTEPQGNKQHQSAGQTAQSQRSKTNSRGQGCSKIAALCQRGKTPQKTGVRWQ